MADINTQSFWDSLDKDMWDETAEMAIAIVLAGIEGGTISLPESAQAFISYDELYAKVLEFAKKYRFTWISGITDVTRTQVMSAITNWIRSGSPLSVLESILTPLFGEARARRIAVTEVTRLFAEGNRLAWESTGFVNQMRWNTAEDEKVCKICGELDGTMIGIGDVDAIPPAHPNCRCYLTPVVDENAFSKKLDEILGL